MYKVDSWDSLYSSGFFDYLDMGAVLAVEWSENIENTLPDDTIRVTIEQGESAEERFITIEGINDENFSFSGERTGDKNKEVCKHENISELNCTNDKTLFTLELCFRNSSKKHRLYRNNINE